MGTTLMFDTTFVPTGRRTTLERYAAPVVNAADPGDAVAYAHWSAKHQDYGIKYGVWCSWDGQICGVFGPLPAGVDDNSFWKIFSLSNLLYDGERVLGDSAFQGTGPEVMCPFKDTNDLTQLAFNYILDSARSLIENVNERLKNFDIICKWTGPVVLEHEEWFALISASVNCDMLFRPLRD